MAKTISTHCVGVSKQARPCGKRILPRPIRYTDVCIVHITIEDLGLFFIGSTFQRNYVRQIYFLDKGHNRGENQGVYRNQAFLPPPPDIGSNF